MQPLTWKYDTDTQWSHDRIVYNDCLYSNLHNYNYIAVLDIDEVGGRSLKLSPPIYSILRQRTYTCS